MPCVNVFGYRRHYGHHHRGGDAAVGAVAGLAGGMMLGTAIAGSGKSKARQAEQVAQKAQQETELLRREQQQEKLFDIKQKMESQQREQMVQQQFHMMQRSQRTINMLILAIVLLFIGLLALGVVIIKK